MTHILARGFIDVQVEKEYKLRNATLKCDNGSAILTLLDNETHIEEEYTIPLSSLKVEEIGPEYATAEQEFEKEQAGYSFVMDLNRPLGAAFDSQGFVIDVSHEKQAHGHIFKGHRITRANSISVKAFSEVVEQIKMMKAHGARSIKLQFVDQDRLEATAIEADRLGALAYGRPHAFILKMVGGKMCSSDKPGSRFCEDELVIDDRDGDLLLTLLPRLKREWNASEKFRALLPAARMANLKSRRVSAVSLSELTEDDDEDLDNDYYATQEKVYESMDQVDCIACLSPKDQVEVITSLDMADQAIILIELKLRGQSIDLLKEMDRIEILSIKASLRTHASEQANSEKCQMLNSDACRLASSGFNTIGSCADFIGGLPSARGAALLRSYRLRGAAAGIVDRLRPSTLATILSEEIRCDYLRGKLLCAAAPDRRGACFQLMDRETQVRTLSEMTDQHRKELLIMSVLWGGPSLEDDLARYESSPAPKKKKSVSKKLKKGLSKASSFLIGKGNSSQDQGARESEANHGDRVSASVNRQSEARGQSESRTRAGTIGEASAGGFVVEDADYTVEMAAQDMVAGAKAAEAAKAAHNASITPFGARGRSKSAASKLWGNQGVIDPPNLNPLLSESKNDGEYKNNGYDDSKKTEDEMISHSHTRKSTSFSYDNNPKHQGSQPESETASQIEHQHAERRVSTADVRSMLRGSIGNRRSSTRSSNGSNSGSISRRTTDESKTNDHDSSNESKHGDGGGGGGGEGYDRSNYASPAKSRKSRRVSSADVAHLLRGSIHTQN